MANINNIEEYNELTRHYTRLQRKRVGDMVGVELEFMLLYPKTVLELDLTDSNYSRLYDLLLIIRG